MRIPALLMIAAVVACSRPDPSPDPESSQPPTMSAAPAPGGDTTLVGPVWHLAELHGSPAAAGAGGRQATLEFVTDGRVAGFGGCNRIAGPYAISGDSLRFGPLVMTRMACDKGMELEAAFATALDSVVRYRREGATLELLVAGGVIARLEAR